MKKQLTLALLVSLTGSLVKITYDVSRINWYQEKSTVKHVDIIQ